LRNADSWLLAVVGTAAVVFFAMTWHYQRAAALFPRLVTFVVAFLCFYQLGGNILKDLANREGGSEERTGPGPAGLIWYYSFLIIAVYYFLIYAVGFLWGTAAFLVVFPLAMGYRRPAAVLAVAVILTALVQIGFGGFFPVPLPHGALFRLFGG